MDQLNSDDELDKEEDLFLPEQYDANVIPQKKKRHSTIVGNLALFEDHERKPKRQKSSRKSYVEMSSDD